MGTTIKTFGVMVIATLLMLIPVHALTKELAPGEEKGNPPAEHAQVIVVGAGMGGMTASLDLAGKGVKVILIEKEEEVGGKVYSPLLGGIPANLGAQYYFTGVHPLVDNSLKAVPAQEIEAGGFFWKGKYEEQVGDSYAPAGTEKDVNRAVEQMRNDFRLASKGKNFIFDVEPRNRNWDRLERMNAYEYLSRFPAHVYEFFQGEIGSETGGNLRELSAIVLVGWNGDVKKARFILKGGNRMLMEKMKEDFLRAGGRVLLHTEVSRVSQNGTLVSVECSDGRKYTAEYSIVTTPAHVTAKIVAGLPAKKAAALAAVAYQPMIELGLHIDNFPKKNIIIWGEGINAILNQTGSVIGEPDRGTVVSITITGTEMLKLDNEALVQSAANVLKKIHPEFIPAKDILGYSVKKWNKGVFKFTAGFASKYQKALREPVGRVYFAGDYVNDPSLMGAAWAGSRAAEEIVKKVSGKGREGKRR